MHFTNAILAFITITTYVAPAVAIAIKPSSISLLKPRQPGRLFWYQTDCNSSCNTACEIAGSGDWICPADFAQPNAADQTTNPPADPPANPPANPGSIDPNNGMP